MQFLVCDRWPLDVRPGSGGHYAYLATGSRHNPGCFHHVVKDLPPGLAVREFFGGVGLCSTVVQQALRPSLHLATDVDPDCAVQLATIPHVRGGWQDARYPEDVPYDLMVLDFPAHTVRTHMAHVWPWAQYLVHRPRYVVWCDTAYRRLGLHRALYSAALGEPVHSHQDYVNAYSRWLWRECGYSITREAHHAYTYLRAEQVPPQPLNVERV